MNTKKRFDTILEKWDLLKHPFYQAWSAGTLPVEALKVYASEYGAFINTRNLNDSVSGTFFGGISPGCRRPP